MQLTAANSSFISAVLAAGNRADKGLNLQVVHQEESLNMLLQCCELCDIPV